MIPSKRTGLPSEVTVTVIGPIRTWDSSRQRVGGCRPGRRRGPWRGLGRGDPRHARRAGLERCPPGAAWAASPAGTVNVAISEAASVEASAPAWVGAYVVQGRRSQPLARIVSWSPTHR